VHNCDRPKNCQAQKYNTLVTKHHDTAVMCLTQHVQCCVKIMFSNQLVWGFIIFLNFLGYLKIANVLCILMNSFTLCYMLFSDAALCCFICYLVMQLHVVVYVI
jgi:hypothetical protein